MIKAIPVKVLASHVIASVSPDLGRAYGLTEACSSFAIFTTDCDDVGYVSLDEASKKANVEVIYGASFYGGANNSSSPYAGEFMGILGANNPADAEAGLAAAVDYAENGANFYSVGEKEVAYFAHLIASSGDYFLKEKNIPLGSSLAYLIAPPLEATVALDAAMKAGNVKMCNYFKAPSATNFSGAWLKGSQSACEAACVAFAGKVKEIADKPLQGI